MSSFTDYGIVICELNKISTIWLKNRNCRLCFATVGGEDEAHVFTISCRNVFWIQPTNICDQNGTPHKVDIKNYIIRNVSPLITEYKLTCLQFGESDHILDCFYSFFCIKPWQKNYTKSYSIKISKGGAWWCHICWYYFKKTGLQNYVKALQRQHIE